jgi:transposase-like protein
MRANSRKAQEDIDALIEQLQQELGNKQVLEDATEQDNGTSQISAQGTEILDEFTGNHLLDLLNKYKARKHAIEELIIALYSIGTSTRDIAEFFSEQFGIRMSSSGVSQIIDEVVQDSVEEWQNRPLAPIYPIVYLDALHLYVRHESGVISTAVYIVMALDLSGRRDILGHWVGDGAEGAKFWLSVVNDLQSRGVQDIFIACIDGLSGFKEAIQAVFPQTQIQRCIVHQIRNSLRYVLSNDRKAFTTDTKAIYKAPTREQAEASLLKLADNWRSQYPVAVASWENNWKELAAFFDYPFAIRRHIYTTNAIENYNLQLRKVLRNKPSLPDPKSVRKLLYLAHERITRKWGAPVPDWALALNQLAIRFEGRFPL